MDKVLITDIKLSNDQENRKLSAQVDDEEVFFSVPNSIELFPVAECFVGVALLEAMISGRTLVVDGMPLSNTFYEHLAEIQAIYACWNPDLNIIDVEAEITNRISAFTNVGSFYSAGVDSSHTLLRHIKEIQYLLMFRSFEHGNDQVSWDERVSKQGAFARSLGLQLIPIQNNVRKWTDKRKISFRFAHGLLLSSVGGALGMRKVYVPSSHTYDALFPWGSHPLSDPLWSTDSTLVVHDSAGFRRSEKVREILNNQLVADNLQVCWKYFHKNCGECSKCARTMIAIHLLGGETKALPKYNNKRTLKKMMPTDENDLYMLEDVMQLSKRTGHEHIHRLLKNYYRRFQLGQILIILDRALLGNIAHTLYRKLHKSEWREWRVTMTGKDRQV